MKDETALVAVKSLHTAIWLFFVACIILFSSVTRLRRAASLEAKSS